MKIAVTNHGFLFAFFYILSFTISFLVVIAYSIRRKIDLTKVLLMLTTVSLMVILGSRLAVVPFRQWGQLITAGSLEDNAGRFAVGGLIFGFAGLILSVRILHMDKSIIRLYGWLAPLGFGIQKIGCFFNGCCYGKLSGMSLGVGYPVCTNAHYHQWAAGLIGENASWSLPVHPVQVYEALCLFLISYIVWKTKDRWKRNWSVLIFSICLFSFFRFACEFFRDTSATYLANDLLWNLKKFQWMLLLSGMVFGIMLYLNEKITLRSTFQSFSSAAPLSRSVIYLVVVAAVIFVFRGIFSKYELVSLDMKLIPAVILTAVSVFKSLPELRIRLATSSYLVLPLLFISLTFPQDTLLKHHRPVENFYNNEVKSYTKIYPGTTFGRYYGEVTYNPHEGTCGTVYTHEDYKHEFLMGGIGISRTNFKDNYSNTYGVNIFAGENKEFNLTNGGEKSFYIYGIDPFFEHNYKWVGVGVGLNVGNLRWIPVLHSTGTSFKDGTQSFGVLPEGYLRIGVKDYFYGRYSYGFNYHSNFPVRTHEFGIGSGFGRSNSLDIMAGVGIGYDFMNAFLQVDALLSKNYGLNFRYNFDRHEQYRTNYSDPASYGHSSWLSVGMNFRFGFKK